MKKKILWSLLFVFLVIITPGKAKALTNCTQLTSGNYKFTESDLNQDGEYCVGEGQDVKVDLNGYRAMTFEVNGNLELSDSSANQEIPDNSTENRGVNFEGNGSVTINNGVYGRIEIVGDIDFTINDGEYANIYFNNSPNIASFDKDEYIKGNFIINGGKFIDLNNNVLYISSVDNVIINNGSFHSWGGYSGVYIGASRNVIINGGTFIFDIGLGFNINNNENVVINDGNFSGVFACRVSTFDSLKINGGIFTGEYGVRINNLVNNEYNYDNVSIEAGTFISTQYIENNNNTNDQKYPIIFEGVDADIFTKVLASGSKYTNEFSSKIVEGYQNLTVADTNEVNVEYIIVDYNIIEGDNQKIVPGSDLKVKADGKLADFRRILVDGEEVDQDNYELEEGSTIVILKDSFINTLSLGEHTLTFVYKNGEANTKFTINKESANDIVNNETNVEKNPFSAIIVEIGNTLKNVPFVIIIVCGALILGGVGFFVYSFMKSKKEIKKANK